VDANVCANNIVMCNAAISVHRESIAEGGAIAFRQLKFST